MLQWVAIPAGGLRYRSTAANGYQLGATGRGRDGPDRLRGIAAPLHPTAAYTYGITGRLMSASIAVRVER